MKRLIIVLTVAALMAVMMSLSAVPAFATDTNPDLNAIPVSGLADDNTFTGLL